MTPPIHSSMNSSVNQSSNLSFHRSPQPSSQPALHWLHRAAVGVMATVAIACQAQPPTPVGSSPSPVSSASSSPIIEAASPAPSLAPNDLPRPIDPSLASYSNGRFGFSFSYAVNAFVVNESSPMPGPEGALADIQIWTIHDDAKIDGGAYEGGTEYPANVSVSVLPNPDGRSLTDWVNQSNWFSLASNFSDTTVAGQAAIAFQSEGLYSNEHVVFSTSDGAHIVLISFGKIQTGDHDAVYGRAFRGILDSFRFTS